MTTLAQEAERLATFHRVLLSVRPGRRFSLNTIRDEVQAAGLDTRSLGSLFQTACHRGWIVPTGSVVPSVESSARGRLVREYIRAALTPARAAS